MEHNTDQFYGTQYRSVLWNTIPISFMEHNTDQFYGTQYPPVLWFLHTKRQNNSKYCFSKTEMNSLNLFNNL
jgi:hypothetical protein